MANVHCLTVAIVIELVNCQSYTHTHTHTVEGKETASKKKNGHANTYIYVCTYIHTQRVYFSRPLEKTAKHFAQQKMYMILRQLDRHTKPDRYTVHSTPR